MAKVHARAGPGLWLDAERVCNELALADSRDGRIQSWAADQGEHRVQPLRRELPHCRNNIGRFAVDDDVGSKIANRFDAVPTRYDGQNPDSQAVG